MTANAWHFSAENYQRERWRNGQGWTREIYRSPTVEAFDWRMSIAELHQDTIYSRFPNYQRIQVLLHGEGIRLHFPQHNEELSLLPPHQQQRFSGERETHCTLINGPSHVFNAIWNPNTIEMHCLLRPLTGTMVFLPESGVQWFAHLIAGQAQLKSTHRVEMDQGDSALISPRNGERLILEGGGTLLLFRVTKHTL